VRHGFGGGPGELLEQRREQPGQGRLGQVAGEQRGDGDAELRTGELEGQLVQRVPDGPGAAVTGVGAGVDLHPVHGDQTELGDHEERVARRQQRERHQREHRGQEQAVHDRFTSDFILPDRAVPQGSHRSPRSCG
jgi:hypothetical protein